MNDLSFDKFVKGPLDRNRTPFFQNETLENRKSFLHVIGNSAILAFHENEKLFEDFILWLRETREIALEKRKKMETEDET